jgi:hypothetical protein
VTHGDLRRGRRGRQSEHEPRTASRPLHGGDLPAVRVDDGSADRESQASASATDIGLVAATLEFRK